jgi:polynucleotide 5'-hydroxyl-kinase GRC3/NOL9
LELIAKQEDSILLSGPASITLKNGKANILGADLSLGRKIIVLKEQQLIVKVDTSASFEINLGKKAKYKVVQGSTIPNSWKEIVKRIKKKNYKRIIVIGGVDSGKSTICTFLANSFLKSGLETNLIDADIGQSDIGPPTTIGLGHMNCYINSLSFVKVTRLFFIGDTTPNQVIEKVILGIKKILDYIESSKLPLIINTDGWIIGPEAINYKRKILNVTSPDLILGIGEVNNFEKIIENDEKRSFNFLHSSNYVKKRSKDERRNLREYGYRKYLENGSIKRISLYKVKFEGIDNYLDYRSRLLGLIDEDGFLQGIGILKEFNESEGEIRIYTPVRNLDGISNIEGGSISISESGKELNSDFYL